MNLPNKITISRIVLTPIVPFFLLSGLFPIEIRYWISFGAFLLIFSTDVFDGLIARKTNSITDFGIILDPIADKILVSTVLITFVYLDMVHPVVVILLIMRDFIVTAIRLMVVTGKKSADRDDETKQWQTEAIMPPISGKIKTVLEVAMIAYILVDATVVWHFCINFALVSLTVAFALYSMIESYIRSRPVLAKLKK